MKKKKNKRKLDLPKGKKGRRSARRRYQKEQLMKRVHDSQKQAEGGGLSILKPDVDVTIWRPNDGSHIIDIIPYLTGKNNAEGDKPGKVHYTFHYYIHKNVGPNNDWYICPARTWGDPCPICEYRAKLLDSGADYDKKIAPLNTKERNLYNIVCYDKGEEKKGVQLWDVSYHYFEKHIIALSKKPARGGREERTVLFFDEEEGKSIAFTIEPAKSKEDYPSFVGHSFDDRDYEIEDEVLDSAHCLDELVKRPTYEELEKAFWGTKGPRDDKDDDDDDDDDDDSGGSDESLDDLLEELDDCETLDELKEFCDDNDIDIKVKGKGSKAIKKNKKKIREWLEENFDEDDDDDDDEDYDDDEDGDDSDSEDDDDEDDDDEDEPKGKRKDKGKKGKGKGKKAKYSVDDIEEMNKRQLKKLTKKEKLDVDPDDADDLDDLQDMVIEELGLDDD